MKEYTYELPFTAEYDLPYYIKTQCKKEEVLFFDIETTGLSAKNSTLYMIGVLYYKNESIHITQWFNVSGNKEAELIYAFENFSKNFTHLIHFNGTGFDIPYLKQKAASCHILFQIENQLKQIDIYKEIRSYKKILDIPNAKQVTIEEFLGISRTDTYTGKELINIYQRYVASKNTEYEKLLLLHNHDDLLGMPKISCILNYLTFLKDIEIEDLQIKDENTDGHLDIFFQYSEKSFLPKRMIYSCDGIYINAWQTEGYISIPKYKTVLYHFFEDYKNYYYLPYEDMAIHKSVAIYVEPANRRKATQKNCYVKKEDDFIPYFSNEDVIDIFKKDYQERKCYQTADSLKENSDLCINYIKNFLNSAK